MDIVFVQELMSNALRIAMMSGAPILLSGMVVGLIIAIVQATTSIQEQTLTFVPKMLAIIGAIAFFGPWIVTNMLEFTTQVFQLIPVMAMP